MVRASVAAPVGAVADGGALAWEAFTTQARPSRPGLPAQWCLAAGEPASLLPPGFTLIDQSEVPGRERRQLLARRSALQRKSPSTRSIRQRVMLPLTPALLAKRNIRG